MRKYVLIILMFSIGILLSACGGSEDTSGNNQNVSTQQNVNENSQNGESGNGETANEQSGEQIVITMADHLPAGHFLIDIAETFQQRVVELTNGQVTFDYYPNEQLGKISETGGLLKDGAVDMAYVHVDSATFLPLTSVTGLPAAWTMPSDGGKVLDELLNEVLTEELEQNKLKPIYSFTNPPNSILSGGEVINSIEDVQGLKIRSGGAVLGQIPELFDGTSVTLNVTEIYEAMQRGVVDAALFPISSAPQYHFEEVTKHLFTGSNFGVTTQFYAMNLDVWNSLPENVQEAFQQAGQEATVEGGEEFDRQIEAALELFENEGIGITFVTQEEHEEILEILAPLDELWLDNVKERGVDGTKVLKSYREASEKAVQ